MITQKRPLQQQFKESLEKCASVPSPETCTTQHHAALNFVLIGLLSLEETSKDFW